MACILSWSFCDDLNANHASTDRALCRLSYRSGESGAKYGTRTRVTRVALSCTGRYTNLAWFRRLDSNEDNGVQSAVACH